MRPFNYSNLKEQKWDSDILGYIAEKLVEIAKIQSTEASNAIEGIVTTRFIQA